MNGGFFLLYILIMKKLFISLILVATGIQSLIAQSILEAKIIDHLDGLAVANAQISVLHQNQKVLSNENGMFQLKILNFPAELLITHLSYKDTLILCKSAYSFASLIELIPAIIDLEEVNILDGLAREGISPLSFSQVKDAKIQSELGDKPLPEILSFTPGVYASRDGGGSGDASINMRGFGQENISVLLNGIPINGAENGLVYWNNWIGLTEVADGIQVQKGIGASLVANQSVGGTINIITMKAAEKRESVLSFQSTDYGNTKTTFQYHSGELPKGLAFNFLVSRSAGDGYIDGTYVNGWSYFVNIRKRINDKQMILFTLLGGPERHGQRNLKLSQTEIDKFGYKYNKDWGELNGKLKNASENFYHKPHLSINHYFTPNQSTIIANSIYFSPGWGGGKWNDSFQYGPGVFDFRTASGQIDWEAIYQYNANSVDSVQLANGETVTGFSKVVQTEYLASHIWTGWIGQLEKQTGFGKLTTGIHYRFFKSDLRQKVRDLLGGNFYLDDYSWSLAGVADRNQVKMPGDIIRVNNGAMLHQTNVFTKFETQLSFVQAFVSVSISENDYRRHDIYNYPENPNSKWVHRLSYDLKGGINCNINENQMIYFNAGLINKAPYYKFVFGNNTNEPSINLVNESVTTLETGYSVRNSLIQFKINAYSTFWRNVSFLSDEYIPLENNRQTRAMVSGLHAHHQGIETECLVQIGKNLDLGAFASFGDWKWSNDVEAKLLNTYDQVIDTVNIYAKGLYVGGQPQIQAGLRLNSHLFNRINLGLETTYNAKHYAMFDPTQRSNPDDRLQPLKLPGYFLMILHFQMPIKILSTDASIVANCENLLNEHYILKGKDGIDHDMNPFRGFWSFGRTFHFGIRITL